MASITGFQSTREDFFVPPLLPTEAEMTLINNYGNEDLTAKIIRLADGTYEYRFIDGSTLKFPVKNKWQKIPKTVKLKRK
jgi:hypothetical protein